MPWDIRGFMPGGCRMPLSHALRAGQFRTGSVNIFHSGRPSTVINNYYNTGYYDDYCSYQGSGMSGIMKWATGLAIGGGIFSALGNIITAWGGRSSGGTEGAGEIQDQTKIQDEIRAAKLLNKQFKDYCDISERFPDGSYFVSPKNGKPERVANYDALLARVQELAAGNTTDGTTPPGTSTVTPTTTTPTETTTVTTPTTTTDNTEGADDLKKKFNMFSDAYISTNWINNNDKVGEPKVGLKVNGEVYDDPIKAYQAYTNGNSFVSKDDLSQINNEINGVYDNGTTTVNGKQIDIKDWKNINSAVYNSGDNTITLNGTHVYKVKDQGGYITLTLINYHGRDVASDIQQTYMLEKTNEGKYQLHQREHLAHGGLSDGYAQGGLWSVQRKKIN